MSHPHNPYGQQQSQQFPTAQQQFGQYQQPQPVAPAEPVGLDDFFSQSTTADAKSLSFVDMPIGTTFTGTVRRQITDSDVEQQIDPQGNPKLDKTGQRMVLLRVPLTLDGDPAALEQAGYTNGHAVWWCKGQAWQALQTAMLGSGVPARTPPEVGARLTITLAERRAAKQAGWSPTNVFAVRYERPVSSGAPPVTSATPITSNTAPVSTPPVSAAPTPPAGPAVAGLDPAAMALFQQLANQQQQK